jgi:hypothetical protein
MSLSVTEAILFVGLFVSCLLALWAWRHRE